MIKNLQRYDNYTKSKSPYMRMAPAYFCHVSFMKMPISCLLKSIVLMKYFESDFLEK